MLSEIFDCIIKIIDLLDKITILFASGAMYFSFSNWLKRKKDMEKIEIYIEKNKQKILLPSYVIRKNFTRAEVYGILGALENDSDFKIKYTSDKNFIKNIFDIQTGKGKELIVKIDENDKFNCDLI